MQGVAESLAGRADIVELETLSPAEILRAQPQVGLEEVVVRGGFPELHANPDIDAVAFHNSYLATYLERDVRSLPMGAACATSSASSGHAPFAQPRRM